MASKIRCSEWLFFTAMIQLLIGVLVPQSPGFRRVSRLMLSILGGVAEFERSIIRERQREGITLAKEKGAYRGRRCALTAIQVAEIRFRAAAGEHKATLAREFNVSRETPHQSLRPTYSPLF